MTFDTKKLRELAEAATPGPWRDANGNGAASVVSEHSDYGCQIYLNVRTCEIADTVNRWKADARFIAAANPQTVIALLDEVARLRAAIETNQLVIDHDRAVRRLAAMTAARDEVYAIAKRTFDRLLMTREEASRLDELRKVGQ